jgi:hypothetical protein
MIIEKVEYEKRYIKKLMDETGWTETEAKNYAGDIDAAMGEFPESPEEAAVDALLDAV